MTPVARAAIYQGFAQRLKTLGAPMPQIDTIGADERAIITLLEGLLSLIERQAKEKA